MNLVITAETHPAVVIREKMVEKQADQKIYS
jgi:hypothetical protein